MINSHFRAFLDFIREQGVVGLAVGFIIGGAVSKVVSAFVSDIINPLLSLVIGATGGLRAASFMIGGSRVLYGDFISVVVDFVIVALVVYFGVKIIGINRLDKKTAS